MLHWPSPPEQLCVPGHRMLLYSPLLDCYFLGLIPFTSKSCVPRSQQLDVSLEMKILIFSSFPAVPPSLLRAWCIPAWGCPEQHLTTPCCLFWNSKLLPGSMWPQLIWEACPLPMQVNDWSGLLTWAACHSDLKSNLSSRIILLKAGKASLSQSVGGHTPHYTNHSQSQITTTRPSLKHTPG